VIETNNNRKEEGCDLVVSRDDDAASNIGEHTMEQKEGAIIKGRRNRKSMERTNLRKKSRRSRSEHRRRKRYVSRSRERREHNRNEKVIIQRRRRNSESSCHRAQNERFA
jgi:hypothetical protein